MSKYRVHLVTVASTQVEVEAADGDQAVEAALSGEIDLPYAPGFANYDFSEWTIASEMFPTQSKPEDDYEEIN